MAHNDHASLAGQYPTTFVPTPTILRRLDQMASQCIDGDNGGAWTPTSPVVVGGLGVSMTANGSLSTVSTGKRAAVGGGVVLTTAYLAISPARARTTVTALRDFSIRHDDELDTARSYREHLASGIVDVATGFSARVPSLRLHKGYTPTNVTLRMRVGTRPAAMPNAMPGFNITRSPASGVWAAGTNEYFKIATRVNSTAYAVGALVLPAAQNGRQFRCSVAGTTAAAEPAAFGTANPGDTVVDGTASWVCETGPALNAQHFMRLPRPTTVDGYFNGGNFQDLAFVPNNIGSFNTDAYSHDVVVTDTSGTLNAFHSLRIDWSLTTGEPML
jgi:hypothetical protein